MNEVQDHERDVKETVVIPSERTIDVPAVVVEKDNLIPMVSIERSKEGVIATREGLKLFFPNAELLQIGCKNCMWRFHGQCPYGYPLANEEMHRDGICSDLISFVVSLASHDDSISAVWEKFHIYKSRLQESVDYADFLRLKKDIEDREKDSMSYNDKQLDELDRLRMDRTAAKMWWARLNQTVIMSLQKVVDREQKKSDGAKLPGIMQAKTINFNITKKDA